MDGLHQAAGLEVFHCGRFNLDSVGVFEEPRTTSFGSPLEGSVAPGTRGLFGVRVGEASRLRPGYSSQWRPLEHTDGGELEPESPTFFFFFKKKK